MKAMYHRDACSGTNEEPVTTTCVLTSRLPHILIWMGNENANSELPDAKPI